VEGGYEDFPIDRDGVPMDLFLNKTHANRASLLFHLASGEWTSLFQEKSESIKS
jgi:hypothetical protein